MQTAFFLFLHIFCRFFWFCSLLILIPIFVVTIYETTQDFLSEQTIIKVDDTMYQVDDYPFPAVTICPDSLVFEELNNFNRKLENGNFTDDE